MPSRHPHLDKKEELCDVFGSYPVVQSKFEPGPGYYVSPLSQGSNPKFKKAQRDQRYWLPPDVVSSNDPVQPPFGALSSGLRAVAGVRLGDKVFAVNRANGMSLAFPFMDGAYGNKVAEYSLSAFLKLGGKEIMLKGKKEKDRRHWDNRGFELLYLAFPNGQMPSQALANFARASNAEEFPVLMSFLAGTRGAADAIAQFLKWKALDDPKPKPPHYDMIESALRTGGFKP